LRAGACHLLRRGAARRRSAGIVPQCVVNCQCRTGWPAGFQSPFVPADARCDITTRARGRLWPRVDDPALSRFFGCRTG
jgi:hypothetical protein